MKATYLTLHTAEGLPLYRFIGLPIEKRYTTQPQTPYSTPLKIRNTDKHNMARYSREAAQAGFACPIWRHSHTTEVISA